MISFSDKKAILINGLSKTNQRGQTIESKKISWAFLFKLSFLFINKNVLKGLQFASSFFILYCCFPEKGLKHNRQALNRVCVIHF